MDRILLPDNGGRRSGGDRRHFSYAVHIPERRVVKDRRCREDRRDSQSQLVSYYLMKKAGSILALLFL